MGIRKLAIFLDRNPTHKEKMQTLFKELTASLGIETTFHLMAPYSPKLNLVEYGIHIIRQKVLHHAACHLGLSAFEAQIQTLCKQEKIFSKEQIINVLEHIGSLVPDRHI